MNFVNFSKEEKILKNINKIISKQVSNFKKRRIKRGKTRKKGNTTIKTLDRTAIIQSKIKENIINVKF